MKTGQLSRVWVSLSLNVPANRQLLLSFPAVGRPILKPERCDIFIRGLRHCQLCQHLMQSCRQSRASAGDWQTMSWMIIHSTSAVAATVCFLLLPLLAPRADVEWKRIRSNRYLQATGDHSKIHCHRRHQGLESYFTLASQWLWYWLQLGFSVYLQRSWNDCWFH